MLSAAKKSFVSTSFLNLQTKSKKGGKDQKSIQSSTTPDQGHHMGKVTKTQLNLTNESKDASSPPSAGDYKAATNRRESTTNTRQNLHKRSKKEAPR